MCLSRKLGSSQILQCLNSLSKNIKRFQIAVFLDNAQPAPSENIIGGLVGALLGSVLGVIVMVIFGQLGRFSAISGLILAVCSIKGYEMLGGTVSKKGIALSMLIVLGMTYVGNYLD